MWSSDTAGQRDAHRLCMQDDCNFVMYKRDNKMMWQTKTQASGGFKMCRMYLRNDGNLAIERDGEEVWNSSQSKGFKWAGCLVLQGVGTDNSVRVQSHMPFLINQFIQ